MFSVAITTYNRPEMTLRAISSVIHNPLCKDVIIVDDHSTPENVKMLFDLITEIKNKQKLTIIVNPENIGMSRNKNKAIYLATSETVLILDSDNYVLDGFFEKAKEFSHLRNTILMPANALPEFHYSDFAGRVIDKDNIKEYLDNPIFRVLLNTCNYFVPREKYHATYKYNPDIKETDTLWFNYLWLKDGGRFFIVPGMDYIHEIHEGSGWLQNSDYNMKKSDEIIKLISEL
jgi:glycosyltransferase involved in cell wall biosynthesis